MDKNACFLSSQNEDVVESELGVQKSTITIAPERSQTGFYTTSCIRTRIYISMAKHRTFFFDLLNPTFLRPLGSKESDMKFMMAMAQMPIKAGLTHMRHFHKYFMRAIGFICYGYPLNCIFIGEKNQIQ